MRQAHGCTPAPRYPRRRRPREHNLTLACRTLARRCAALAGCALGALTGCAPAEEHPGAHFYYPVDELLDGLVYAYAPVVGPGDSASFPPHYWYLRSVAQGDSVMLVSTYYDYAFEPRQYVAERLVSTGSLLRDLRLMSPTDSASDIASAEVLAPALFSFAAGDTAKLLVQAVRLPLGGGVTTLTRNRRYRGDTTLEVLGARRAGQNWAVRELIEQDSAGVLATETTGLEVYAEGLGLAYRERRYGNGVVEAYRLAERFPMDTLTARRDARVASDPRAASDAKAPTPVVGGPDD